MGLLDDAIREHLELKRRAGTDPGELARVEREALDPSFDPDATRGVAVGLDPGGRLEADEHALLSQETAELDMATVLNEDAAISVSDRREVEPPPGSAESESLEWEMPMRTARSSVWAAGASSDLDAIGTHQRTDDAWRSEAPRVHAGLDRDPGALAEQIPGQERLSLD
jgi:hypothetical protein